MGKGSLKTGLGIMAAVLVTFLIVLKKDQTKVTSGRRSLFQLHFEDTVHDGAKSWQQKSETVGHMVSAVRKQRKKNAIAQLTVCFLFSPGPQFIG